MLAASVLTLGVAGCGSDPASSAPSPTPSPTASQEPIVDTAASDLSAIACATADPDGVGPLTGAWQADDGGVYYIRQVGDCVWWFGTEIQDIELGPTGQHGYANIAFGRIDGTRVEVEWADAPLGDILNGGGLTLVYYEDLDQLAVIEQRGDGIPFGTSTLTRVDPDASPSASASP